MQVDSCPSLNGPSSAAVFAVGCSGRSAAGGCEAANSSTFIDRSGSGSGASSRAPGTRLAEVCSFARVTCDDATISGCTGARTSGAPADVSASAAKFVSRFTAGSRSEPAVARPASCFTAFGCGCGTAITSFFAFPGAAAGVDSTVAGPTAVISSFFAAAGASAAGDTCVLPAGWSSAVVAGVGVL